MESEDIHRLWDRVDAPDVEAVEFAAKERVKKLKEMGWTVHSVDYNREWDGDGYSASIYATKPEETDAALSGLDTNKPF